MLKSSGRRYSSSSESQADVECECDDVGEEELLGEKGDSSMSRRCNSDPILSLGTRWERWKYDRRLQYFETYAKSCRDMRTSSSLGIAAKTWPLVGVGRSRRYRGMVAFGMVGGVLAAVAWAGERPIAGPVGVVASLIKLPSIAERCVILKVPASCASDTVGVVRPRGVSTAVSMLSPSSMLMSWILTVDWISAVFTPDISGSPDSSDAMLSPLGSSDSPTIEAWCRIDGLLRDRTEGADIDVGRTVGDLI